VNTVKIHYAYAVDNPMNHEGYGPDCWGLTASDDPDGYTAHEPWNNDNGTISPTAALASMPYLPVESMRFLKYLYRQRGQELFGIFGPYDAFNDSRNWIKEAYIGIDQGPIVVMIENHRTGLLWKNVMKDTEVQAGLEKLGFQYQDNSVFEGLPEAITLEVSPNPVSRRAFVALPQVNSYFPVTIRLFNTSGQLVRSEERLITSPGLYINCSGLSDGLWFLEIRNGTRRYVAKLMVEK